MKTLSLKVSAPMDAKLTAIAKRTRRKKTAVAREALVKYLASDSGKNGKNGEPIYELIRHLSGSVTGAPTGHTARSTTTTTQHRAAPGRDPVAQSTP